MNEKRESEKVSCFNCLSFYITYELRFPYGCRAIGFKSARMPSQEVSASSGMVCQFYKAKQSPSKRVNQSR